ncbi:PA0069 family radical SAM protein [Marivirga sp. S37H4]|uniref:PA0069 family radical SAM protein n=2 Tax=Marivirga aurantiaca TaxID=2802615 RepID=A0A934WZN3_9BACT|nr:PA0069 family radical SAM protein [Marivirga aurantiaca]MBK6265755.1 PA0069 family radical SAM protein [Marivirga aurantiaca]
MDSQQHIRGRGAQHHPSNQFLKQAISLEEDTAIDEYTHLDKPATQIFYESPRKIVNKVTSPDVGMDYSLNPYQGCEHGCVYCYARTTHEFWGYDAGLDFESKIIVKKNAASLLEKELLKPGWKVKPIVLSGNTDCYQPLEQKLRITRSLLEVFAKYRHPVGIITKNVACLNDLDVLKDLAADNLVRVIFSITSLDENLRAKLEPRTASAKKKLEAIEILSQNNIPVSVMTAPIIPGLNHHEIPSIIEAATQRGAINAGYTVVRLNGAIKDVFSKWLQTHFPDRYHKVWAGIASLHGGEVNDSVWKSRMRGAGPEADIIKQLFEAAKKKYMDGGKEIRLDTTKFRKGGNYKLF